MKFYCVSGLGKELVNKLELSMSIKVVRNCLNEMIEVWVILDVEGYVFFFGIFNIVSII